MPLPNCDYVLSYAAIAFLIFIPDKISNMNQINNSKNTTKQQYDIGQLVTSFSCDMLQTAPSSQMHTIKIIIFRLI